MNEKINLRNLVKKSESVEIKRILNLTDFENMRDLIEKAASLGYLDTSYYIETDIECCSLYKEKERLCNAIKRIINTYFEDDLSISVVSTSDLGIHLEIEW